MKKLVNVLLSLATLSVSLVLLFVTFQMKAIKDELVEIKRTNERQEKMINMMNGRLKYVEGLVE